MNKHSKKDAWLAHASISEGWLPQKGEKEREKRNKILVVSRTFYSFKRER